MRYCRICITPENRPNTRLDADGVCNAAHVREKDEIDWKTRTQAFAEIVAETTALNASYDCIVPVSGGKDSTWQVLKCLEYGLHPLALTWRAPGRNELGAANLQNLVGIGVDHIDFQINPRVERRFTYAAFDRFGTPALPMHLAIFSLPLQFAVRFDIPLVVFGENSAFEYGGSDSDRGRLRLDSAWVKKYGVTHGTTAQDWVGDSLSKQDLLPYTAPADDVLEKKQIRAIFLGSYFRWDPEISREAAVNHGFRARVEGAKTGVYDYADIDDDFISIHHWMKWYKFGFTRSFDNLSTEIRNGRMTREEAIFTLRQRGDETPWADIDKFCSWIGYSRERFFATAERFRNPDVWVRRGKTWMIDDFLVPDWKWT